MMMMMMMMMMMIWCGPCLITASASQETVRFVQSFFATHKARLCAVPGGRSSSEAWRHGCAVPLGAPAAVRRPGGGALVRPATALPGHVMRPGGRPGGDAGPPVAQGGGAAQALPGGGHPGAYEARASGRPLR